MKRFMLTLVASVLAVGGLTLFATPAMATDHHSGWDHRNAHHEWVEHHQFQQPCSPIPCPSSYTPCYTPGCPVPQYPQPTVIVPYAYPIPQYPVRAMYPTTVAPYAPYYYGGLGYPYLPYGVVR